MNTASNLRTNSERLWDSLMEMAKIGPGVAGGNNRQTLTDDDARARALFTSWCESQNLSVTVDTMGNIFARRAGTDDSLDPVMVGSHLDTQPTGGKYDGILGVLGGLEIVRTLNDMNITTRRPIEVVNWTNEEGTRFAPAMVSSGVFAGVYDLDYAYSRTDTQDLTQGEELKRIGYVGDEPVGEHPLHSYFELHIEQGPILEDEDLDVGVVSHGQGLRWIEITLTGFESHTGSTPMPKRRNALLGASRIVELVDKIAHDNAPYAVGTVGMLDVYPNSRNIIPGQVTFCVDIRSPSDETLRTMEKAVYDGAKDIAGQIGLEVDLKDIGQFDPVTFDETCVGAVRDAAAQLGYKHKDIVSGAGHDACHIAKVAPTAMIFCPCVDGVSHNESEEISKEWATAGADVLLHAVLETAEIVEQGA